MFTGVAIRTISCQTTVSVIYIFQFDPDSLSIEHLKLSCGIHSFSLNLNFDFFEIITLYKSHSKQSGQIVLHKCLWRQ